MRYYFPLACLFLLSCSNYTYVEFENFEFEKANIKNGVEVDIISVASDKRCTDEIEYYYSVIALVKETQDTVRILTPCQLFSNSILSGSFRAPNPTGDSLLKAAGYDYGNRKKIIVMNSRIPFQNRNYPVAIGSIGFKDDNDEILKEDFTRHNWDTNLVNVPKEEVKF